MAQWVEILASRPKDLSLTFRHHKVSTEKISRAVLWLPYMCYVMFEPTYKIKEIRAGEELAAKTDGLSFIPGTHIIGENLFLQVLF